MVSTIVEGNQVAAHWVATGTHDGPLMDIPAAQKVRFEGMGVNEKGGEPEDPPPLVGQQLPDYETAE